MLAVALACTHTNKRLCIIVALPSKNKWSLIERILDTDCKDPSLASIRQRQPSIRTIQTGMWSISRDQRRWTLLSSRVASVSDFSLSEWLLPGGKHFADAVQGGNCENWFQSSQLFFRSYRTQSSHSGKINTERIFIWKVPKLIRNVSNKFNIRNTRISRAKQQDMSSLVTSCGSGASASPFLGRFWFSGG